MPLTYWRLTFAIILVTGALSSCTPADDTETFEAEGTDCTQQGVTLEKGFHKEELVAGDKFHWVRQQATLTMQAPTSGSYRLGFRFVTVFSPNPNVIAVTVNDQPAGTIAVTGSDFANAPSLTVEAVLNAGENRISLSSREGDVRLGPKDDRMAAFGLVGAIALTPIP